MNALAFEEPLNALLRGSTDVRALQILSGVLGSGKTSILRELARENSGMGRASGLSLAFVINLEHFNPGYSADGGGEVPVGILQGSYMTFVRLLASVMTAGRGTDQLTTLEKLDIETRQSCIYTLRVSRFDSTIEDAHASVLDDLGVAWVRAARTVGKHFENIWNETAEETRVLMLLDNLESVENQVIGQWLADLLPRLANTVTIAALDADQKISVFRSTEPGIIDVPQLDKDAVEAWCRDAVDDERPVHPVLLDQIFEVSQGHPATLVLAKEVVWGTRTPPPSGPHPWLKNLPEGREARMSTLADRFLHHLGDPLLSLALQAASIPRTFDKRLLDLMLDDGKVTPQDTLEPFRRIRDYAFTEDLSEPWSRPESDKHVRLRIHPAIREGILDHLMATNSELYESLNTRAADHYLSSLVTYEHRDTEYGRASVYEEPGWQADKREWLYHTGLVSGEAGKRDALVQIAQVFLDAWWWWGSYVHFDFCDQIMADLEVLAERRKARVHGISAWPEIASMHRCIRDLVRNYPLGEDAASDDRWQNAHQSLLYIRSLCGLQDRSQTHRSEDLERLPATDRQASALINVFLGESLRYQEGATDQEVDEFYRKAEAQFTEEWSQAWVAYHRAQFFHERGRPQQARTHWTRSAEKCDVNDHELAANLHLLQGDMDWDRPLYEDAARSYGRAVLHAYLFHFVNGNPDEYTMQFYIDARTHVVERLYELAGRRGDTEYEAKACAMVMSGEMGPGHPAPAESTVSDLLGDNRPVELAHALFPRGPLVSELEMFESDFHRNYHRLSSKLNLHEVRTDLVI